MIGFLLAETITLEQKSDGCCGQQQKVICNVTGLEIMVTAGTIERIFRYDTRNSTFDMNGFVMRVVDAMPHPTFEFVFVFIVEILYLADAKTWFHVAMITPQKISPSLLIVSFTISNSSWKAYIICVIIHVCDTLYVL